MPVAATLASPAPRDVAAADATLVLLVDDDPLVAQLVQAALPPSEFQLRVAKSGAAALAACQQQRPQILLLDNVLPDASGLSLLAQFRERDATLPVIFITAHGNSQTAIEAMKQGAFDYLTKPLDLAGLESQVRLAREARRLMRVPVVIQGAGDDAGGDPLIGVSPGMAEVFKGIGRAAARDLSVLLVGECGTGKALVARAIYQNSLRSAAPFRALTCSDFDAHELEVELFGSEAPTASVGRIEQCAGGTLLLQEIGDTSAHVQSRLMRFLASGQFEPLGGQAARTADVRLLATSSQDLKQLVEAGRFRADLYYHLCSLALHLPPLRARPGDLPLLVDHFVKRFSRLSRQHNGPAVRVSPEALQLLSSYDWPGNLDELQSVVRQGLVENTGTLLPSSSLQQLLRPTRSAESPNDRATDWRALVAQRLQDGTTSLYAEALGEMERHVLALVMESTGDNQAHSARLLGITRGNLRKKLRTLGLIPPATAEDEASAAAEAPDGWPAS
jgi:DNA-binding NtrC family response regulator